MSINIPRKPSKPLKLAFTYDSNSKWSAKGLPQEECEEFADAECIETIANSLKKLGSVEEIDGFKALAQRVVSSDPDWHLVFNICEGYGSIGREGQVPALLEAWGIPFTLSDSATMALCQDKATAKMIIEHHQIPTAPFVAIPPRNTWPTSDFDPLTVLDTCKYRDELQTFPLFVKPSSVSTGIGITQESKVSNREELVHIVDEVSKRHPTAAVLVERFLDGREFTVGFIGTGAEAQVIGVREFIYLKSGSQNSSEPAPDVYCNDLKWNGSPHMQRVNVDLKDPVVQSVAEVALKAWRVLGCRDGGRVDMRLDSKDVTQAVPNFIEANPIPGMMRISDLVLLAEGSGIDYDGLLSMIVHSALKRYNKA